MKMNKIDIVKYPQLAKCVKNDVPKACKDPKISGALRDFGHLSGAILQRAMAWDSGPDIVVAAGLGAYGDFTPEIGSNEIRISQKLVQDYELDLAGILPVNTQYMGRQSLILITLLHELCHWGDDKVGNPNMVGEEGEAFEAAVYGRFGMSLY